MTGGISYWNVIPAGLIAVFCAVAGQQYADTSYSAGNSYEPPSYYQQPQPQYQQYQSQPPQYGTDGPYGYAATFAPSTPSYSTPIPYQPAPQPYQPQQSFGPTSNSAGSPTPTSNSYAAVCDFPTGAGQRRLLGRLRLAQAAGPSQPVRVNGYISGLNPGKHGIHIHMYGDFSNGCTSAGEHYNPLLVNHGAPQDDELHRHVGDLGNVDADANGVAYLDVVNPFVSLAEGGRHPVGGRSVVVHEMTDDLGRGGNEESRKTGNSGARVGCCAIVYIDPSRT